MFAKSKFLPFIAVYFVVMYITSNITAVKLFDLTIHFPRWDLPLTLDGWTFLFPLTYIIWDVVTEVYGYKTMKKLIWMAIAWALLYVLSLLLVKIIPPSAYWDWNGSPESMQASFEIILWSGWRIILGSICAFVVWWFVNAFVLSKMKVLTAWKFLRARTIWSTLFGQLLDSAIFAIIAFSMIIPSDMNMARSEVWVLIYTWVIVKVVVEALFTPITYAVINFVKKRENIDVYDEWINYNPFNLND